MGELIKFPLRNSRTELGFAQSALEKDIESIKLGKFSMVADEITDDVIRSIQILRLEETVEVSNEIETKDYIMLKEAIVAIMCKIVKIEHPLHDIEEQELIVSETIEDVNDFDIPSIRYRFKSEPEDKLRSEF